MDLTKCRNEKEAIKQASEESRENRVTTKVLLRCGDTLIIRPRGEKSIQRIYECGWLTSGHAFVSPYVYDRV